MFSQVGPLEIVLIVVVLLIVFGPTRLPSLGRSLGSGIREFKQSLTGDDKAHDAAEATDRPALGAAQPPAGVDAPAPPVGSSAAQPPAGVDAPAPPVGSSAAQGGEAAPERRD